jgi:hypothetical protein
MCVSVYFGVITPRGGYISKIFNLNNPKSEVAGSTFLLEFLNTGQPTITVNNFKCVFHKKMKFRYETRTDNKYLQKHKIKACYSNIV